MSRFPSRQALEQDIVDERRKLQELLDAIPPDQKLVEVVDGMTVKDFLAHRTEWGRMLESWYREARAGGSPAVPSERYSWKQLPALNAEIRERFADAPLEQVERDFAEVHDRLLALVATMTEEELFSPRHFPFTGTTDLAAYVNSATAAHYRSARKHIARWWRARRAVRTGS